MLFVEFPAFTKAVTELPDDDYTFFQRELVSDPERGPSFGAQAAFARPAWPSRAQASARAEVLESFIFILQNRKSSSS
jgi:hypothetical protein